MNVTNKPGKWPNSKWAGMGQSDWNENVMYKHMAHMSHMTPYLTALPLDHVSFTYNPWCDSKLSALKKCWTLKLKVYVSYILWLMEDEPPPRKPVETEGFWLRIPLTHGNLGATWWPAGIFKKRQAAITRHHLKYCWWKKSQTTPWDVSNLVNNGINWQIIISSCWLNQPHLKNMRKSNWIISPGPQGEKKKCLKPPPRCIYIHPAMHRIYNWSITNTKIDLC